MLRPLALLLVLANLLMWAYTQGHLAGLGWAPEVVREPHRLAQQVAPEQLQLLNPAPAATAESAPTPAATQPAESPPPAPEAASPAATPVVAAPVLEPPTPAAPPEPTRCWQLAGINASQTILINAALQKLPALNKRWTLTESVTPGRWIVYLGKFPNAEALQRSRDALKQLGIDHRDVNSPTLSPGLALGTFSTDAGAQQALQQVTKDGVRGARVVQVRPDTRSLTLTLAAITDAERQQVQQLPPLADKPLQRCP